MSIIVLTNFFWVWDFLQSWNEIFLAKNEICEEFSPLWRKTMQFLNLREKEFVFSGYEGCFVQYTNTHTHSLHKIYSQPSTKALWKLMMEKTLKITSWAPQLSTVVN